MLHDSGYAWARNLPGAALAGWDDAFHARVLDLFFRHHNELGNLSHTMPILSL